MSQAEFTARLRFTQFVEVHYLDELGEPQVLGFKPHQSVIQILGSDLQIAHPGMDGLKITEIQLNKMLASIIFTCLGCDYCDGKGAGAVWVRTQQGHFFVLPWELPGEY